MYTGLYINGHIEMDTTHIRRLVADKLHDRETYVIAATVGTLINVYGQLLVPWFRGDLEPFAVMGREFLAHPALTSFSVVLAYAFPMVVGVMSSVITRYKNRRIESVADFPERKPDQVFRASRDGRLVEIGATTLEMFGKHHIDSAQKILGDAIWSQIAAAKAPGGGQTVFFDAEGKYYVVSYAPTANDQVNVYMTCLPASGRNLA